MRFTIFTGFHEYLDNFEQLVESINSQTYTNWEWIVADDFSTNPEVSKKLEELVNTNPKVKLAKPSYKKEFYWNPPINMSTGDIFVVVDSDDIIFPKFLEVYKYNFEKFPEVHMISSNSIVYNEKINGSLRSTRYINYRNNCNLHQSINDTSYEYNFGDGRAWRNNIKKFSEKDEWKFCAEDFLKITVSEELGKILFLPRSLYGYSYRESSISHEVHHNFEIFNEGNSILEKANNRVDRKNLNSINDYYDRAFNHTTAFYLSEFNKEKNCCDVNYFSPTINPREMEILKNLYSDHNLTFNDISNKDYLIVKIIDSAEIESLYQIWNYIKPKKHLIIQSNSSLRDDIINFMHINSPGPFSWFDFYDHINIIQFQ